MCTPWTMSRFVRWRVWDRASCFLSCSLPLDSSSPQLAAKNNKVFKMKEETKVHKAKKKSSGRSKCSKNETAEDSSWPNFADEDYIVFCFREDGAFDVVKDGKAEASNHLDYSRSSLSRSINGKLNYDVSNQKMLHEDGTNPKNEVEEEESIYLDAQSTSRRVTRTYQIEQIEEHGGMVSVESSDSNHSDNSTGSFAFPVLGWEWMGSPVQMPKSERMHLRKHKARCVRFQCCRF